MTHLHPVLTVLLAAIALAAMLTLLGVVTSRPSNDPDLPPRL